MIRFFNLYYPRRVFFLLAGEAFVVWISLLIGAILCYREDSYVVLTFGHGYYKLLVLTALTLLFSHWLSLYDLTNFGLSSASYQRLLLVPAMVALMSAAAGYLFPGVLLGNSSLLVGLGVMTVALTAWRYAYCWLAQQRFLQQRVYILGVGERAARLVRGLRQIPQLGIDVVGWSGNITGELTRESLAADVLKYAPGQVHRVIVAMDDRRESMPVLELLQLRLIGIQVEDATSWLEKLSGKIDVQHLCPSWIIFAHGFRFGRAFQFARRALSFCIALVALLLVIPIIPLVAFAIMLDSPGPLFYAQKRVGHMGKIFSCYKFRTMKKDAEADTGPTWADDDDPRITRVGKWLRIFRLDEIPQLWCVLKGDMALVGPRPERPEFVEQLTKEIPYYNVRHVVRPGITGWAQIRYKYGNTVEHAKEKLQYDLFYVKNTSLTLDLLIIFETLKTITLGRGAL